MDKNLIQKLKRRRQNKQYTRYVSEEEDDVNETKISPASSHESPVSEVITDDETVISEITYNVRETSPTLPSLTHLDSSTHASEEAPIGPSMLQLNNALCMLNLDSMVAICKENEEGNNMDKEWSQIISDNYCKSIYLIKGNNNGHFHDANNGESGIRNTIITNGAAEIKSQKDVDEIEEKLVKNRPMEAPPEQKSKSPAMSDSKDLQNVIEQSEANIVNAFDENSLHSIKNDSKTFGEVDLLEQGLKSKIKLEETLPDHSPRRKDKNEKPDKKSYRKRIRKKLQKFKRAILKKLHNGDDNDNVDGSVEENAARKYIKDNHTNTKFSGSVESSSASDTTSSHTSHSNDLDRNQTALDSENTSMVDEFNIYGQDFEGLLSEVNSIIDKLDKDEVSDSENQTVQSKIDLYTLTEHSSETSSKSSDDSTISESGQQSLSQCVSLSSSHDDGLNRTQSDLDSENASMIKENAVYGHDFERVWSEGNRIDDKLDYGKVGDNMSPLEDQTIQSRTELCTLKDRPSGSLMHKIIDEHEDEVEQLEVACSCEDTDGKQQKVTKNHEEETFQEKHGSLSPKAFEYLESYNNVDDVSLSTSNSKEESAEAKNNENDNDQETIHQHYPTEYNERETSNPFDNNVLGHKISLKDHYTLDDSTYQDEPMYKIPLNDQMKEEQGFLILNHHGFNKTKERMNRETLPIHGIFAEPDDFSTKNGHHTDSKQNDGINDHHENQKLSENDVFGNEVNNKEIFEDKPLSYNVPAAIHETKNHIVNNVEVLSKHKLQSKEIDVFERSSEEEIPSKEITIVVSPGKKMGLLLGKNTGKAGIVVLQIRPYCSFSNEIAPGDMLCAINGKDVSSLSLKKVRAILSSEFNESRSLVFLSNEKIPEINSTSFVRDDKEDKNSSSDTDTEMTTKVETEVSPKHEHHCEEMNEGESSSEMNQPKKRITVVVPPGKKLYVNLGKRHKKSGIVLKIHPDCSFRNEIALGDKLCAINGKDVGSLSLKQIGVILSSQFNQSRTMVFLSDEKTEEINSASFIKDDVNNLFSDSAAKTTTKAETPFDGMPTPSIDAICDNKEYIAPPGKLGNNTIPDILTTTQGVEPIYKIHGNQSPGDKQQLNNNTEKDTGTSPAPLPKLPSTPNQSCTLTVASHGTPKRDITKKELIKNKKNNPIYILDEDTVTHDSIETSF